MSATLCFVAAIRYVLYPKQQQHEKNQTMRMHFSSRLPIINTEVGRLYMYYIYVRQRNRCVMCMVLCTPIDSRKTMKSKKIQMAADSGA